MKSVFRILLLIAILAISFAPPVSAEKYQYGTRHAVALTNAAAITVDPAGNTLTYATVTIAQATTLNATVTKCRVGDIIYLQVTADGTNRVLTYTGNIVGVAYTVTASKTFVITLVYNGSKFYAAGVLQVN
jgi:hypothetical protein